MNTNIVPLNRTYTAAAFKICDAGLSIQISGTLDGMVDLAITESNGRSATYQLTPVGIKQLSVQAKLAAEDVEKNCLYDRDALLVDRS